MFLPAEFKELLYLAVKVTLLDFPTQVCVCTFLCTHSFREHPHEFRKLVCEQSQHGGEGTQAGCEEDEEGQLLLRVH